MDVIRILLADDHPVVRDGIRNRLDREADLTVVGEAANGEETIRQVRRSRPDVVLLDVAMPGPGAVPVMEALPHPGGRRLLCDDGLSRHFGIADFDQKGHQG